MTTLPGSAGLTRAEAERRLADVGPNALPEAPRLSPLARVLAQLRDPMILLLLAAGLLTVLVADAADAAVIGIVVVVNTAIGVTQDLRADRAVAELGLLTAPEAAVVRDGAEHVVPAADLVPGDVVRLEAGAIVPADLVVLEAFTLSVDESAMTGESQPVDRRAGEELLAGTVTTRGRAVGEVLRTGPASGLGRIAALIGSARVRDTPLQLRLRRLSRDLVLLVLAIGVAVLVLGLVRGQPLVQTSVLAVSLAVAAVPESLPAVVTISLALGAHRMALRNALVRHLPAVETLGSVTVIASDKTGTLTEGRMVAGAVWLPPGHRYEVSGAGYAPEGDVVASTGPPEAGAALERLLRDAVLCNDARLVAPPTDAGDWQAVGDTLEAALLALALKGGTDPETTRTAWPRVHETPFEAELAWMSTTHAGSADGALVVCKGAPEAVLPRLGPTADGVRRAMVEETRRLADLGFRVLAVADAAVPAGVEPDSVPLDLVGLVGISDPPRAVSREIVDACQSAGIKVLLVTGDHPRTAHAIASQVGIAVPGSAPLTGAELAAGEQGDDTTRVYARIRPEQKVLIIHELQERGEVVAMTGDGVNDAPALRTADIGVAMGRGGTEVARQAADLVLADDDLRTVVVAVEEGRRIYTNIRNFLRYAVSGGLAEVLVVLFGPLAGMSLPLLPAQILWINMLTHGLPGVAFGAEPVAPDAMRHPPRSPDESVLGAGLGRQIAWIGTLIGVLCLGAGVLADRSGWHVQTSVFVTLGLAQLGVALALRAPGRAREHRALDLAVLGAAALQLAGVYAVPLQDLLGTQALPATALAALLAVAVVPGVAVRASRVAARRLAAEAVAAGVSGGA